MYPPRRHGARRDRRPARAGRGGDRVHSGLLDGASDRGGASPGVRGGEGRDLRDLHPARGDPGHRPDRAPALHRSPEPAGPRRLRRAPRLRPPGGHDPPGAGPRLPVPRDDQGTALRSRDRRPGALRRRSRHPPGRALPPDRPHPQPRRPHLGTGASGRAVPVPRPVARNVARRPRPLRRRLPGRVPRGLGDGAHLPRPPGTVHAATVRLVQDRGGARHLPAGPPGAGVSWKRWLLGTPFETQRAQQERLGKPIALAVFASDALSSVAYATEEILLVLSLAGVAALSRSLPISGLIILLLALLIASYRQTVYAYPEGGGSYIVARENLGTMPGLVAAAALLIDYILTVAVSTAAGVAAVTSAVPFLREHRVAIGLLFIAVLMVGNLRGVRESGAIFAVPTYLFIAAMGLLILGGIARALLRYPPLEAPVAALPPATHALTLFLLMRAFSAGCTALTGIEAISNGIQAFRPPESKNAATTLVILGLILGVFFLGTSYLAHAYVVVPGAGQTVISQLGHAVFGSGPLYYFLQLSAILARDRFLPCQLSSLGDRLVFSNGIVVLAGTAGLLIVRFGGDTHALIPLYAVGVFLAFTLSQSGMVMRHLRRKEGRYRLHAAVNAAGAMATGAALLVIAVTRFLHGAWIVIALIPLFVVGFLRTHRHYFYVRTQLSLVEIEEERPIRHTAIVPISAVNRATVHALRYAKSIAHEVEAVHIAIDPKRVDLIREQWKTWGGGVPLRILESRYRTLIEPLVDYIDALMHGKRRNEMVTVVLPEFVTAHWWEGLFHNQSAFMIKGALLFKPGVVVTSIPFHFSR